MADEKDLNETEQKASETNTAEAQEANGAETDTPKEKTVAEVEAEWNDKYIRLYSEFENARRRNAKERIELIGQAGKDIIVDLLPLMDDFERAIENNKKSEDLKSIKEGFDLIYKKLWNTLETNGVKPMNAQGDKFDPEIHEAITKIPAPSKQLRGKVVDEIEKGYYLKDKVVRYSKVVVGE